MNFELTNQKLIEIFAPRTIVSHKGSFGQAVICGGSHKYVGAPQFSAMSLAETVSNLGKASMLSGAGTSILAVPDFLASELYKNVKFSGIYPLNSDGKCIKFDEKQFEELTKKASAFAVGMGMDNGESKLIAEYLLNNTNLPFVVDADALFLTKDIPDFKSRVILTPHIGEMAKMLGVSTSEMVKMLGVSNSEISQNMIEICKQYAKDKNAVVVLKSHQSVVSDGQNVYINKTGNAKLSKGGSGDVLAGIICGLLSFGISPFESAVVGSYILGRCAELSTVNEFSHQATDIVDVIPKVIDEILG